MGFIIWVFSNLVFVTVQYNLVWYCIISVLFRTTITVHCSVYRTKHNTTTTGLRRLMPTLSCGMWPLNSLIMAQFIFNTGSFSLCRCLCVPRCNGRCCVGLTTIEAQSSNVSCLHSLCRCLCSSLWWSVLLTFWLSATARAPTRLNPFRCLLTMWPC